MNQESTKPTASLMTTNMTQSNVELAPAQRHLYVTTPGDSETNWLEEIRMRYPFPQPASAIND